MSFQRQYCSACGDPLGDIYTEGRKRLYCAACDRISYRNPKPCAGVLVVDNTDRLLLVKRTEPPAVGSWSVPAGYLEHDEPPQAAAVRELHEETGLRSVEDDLELFETVFVEHPDGLHVLVVVYLVSLDSTTGAIEAGDDARAAQFWTPAELSEQGERVEPGYESLLAEAVDAITQPNE